MDGSDIKALRTKLGLTQMQFAAALGIQVAQLSRWENLHHKPGKLWVEQIKRQFAGQVEAMTAESEPSKSFT